MDELIGRLVANVGVDKTAAEKSVGIILDFLKKERSPRPVQALLDKLPGAEALIAQQADAGGGMFSMGGIMGAGTKMMAAGLSMGQVQGVTKEVIAFAREKAGEDTIARSLGPFPASVSSFEPNPDILDKLEACQETRMSYPITDIGESTAKPPRP